ncbi:hypothetical protein HAX54_045650 [Datura stramonium]|uniref:Dirigent protein n=1 Tax=Datura stramonium TaxID=4076 RepID=A0ABS8RPH4_DATST|nr:hypothetical protein [Datura stramonium]
MLNTIDGLARRLVGSSFFYMSKFLFRILCVGPMPNHIAFILDGNRRYAKQQNMAEGSGHRAGFLAVISMPGIAVNWVSNTSQFMHSALIISKEVQRKFKRHTYMRLAPDPDILIRTSGETRSAIFFFGRVQTAYCIPQRIAISQTINSPFGTLYVFQDPLTLKANSNSKIVGTAEGTSITSSLDGLQSVSIAKITLKMKHHKGSISVMGGTHNKKPLQPAVVGGTGDFLFVQGYVTLTSGSGQGHCYF